MGWVDPQAEIITFTKAYTYSSAKICTSTVYRRTSYTYNHIEKSSVLVENRLYKQ